MGKRKERTTELDASCYAGVPAAKHGPFKRCVDELVAEGRELGSAIAICKAQFAESVEQVLEPHSLETVLAPIAPRPGPDFAGREWEVTIIGAEGPADILQVRGKPFIRSKNGRLYSADGLRASVPMWDGVRVYDNHLTDKEFDERAGMRSVAKEWLGSIVSPWWDDARYQLRGILKVADEAMATKLYNAHQSDILHTVGLSIDTVPEAPAGRHEGMPVIEGFSKIFSVDLVAEPAAGGGFNRLIAAKTHQEDRMSEERKTEQLELSPELVAEIKRIVADALAAAAQETAQAAPPEPAPEFEAVEEPTVTVDDLRRLECKIALREMLDKSKLAESARAIVENAYTDKIFDRSEVERMIETVRKAVATGDVSGRVQGAGDRRPTVAGMDRSDWAAAEFLRIVAGNTKYRAMETMQDVTVQERLPESYRAWVKNGRQRGDIRGLRQWMYEFYPQVEVGRTLEAVTTSSMSSIVKSALNVILAADFQARHQWWAPIVREEEVDSIDAPTLVRVFGLSNLDVVEEGQAYTELAWVDEEETAAFVKRGNYVGVTLETLLLDKVNKVRAIPQLLADSWYNTLSYRVANVFMTNTATGPVLADTGALFNATATSSAAGHANLLTAALSFSSYGASRLAMRKQTAGDSGAGAKLLIRPRYLLVPVDLEATAIQIVKSEQIPNSANNDPNPYYNESEVIVVPEWTDANDWAFVADPAQFPCIWMLYYRGNRVPELFSSEDESQGAMFTNDTLRFKVRMLSFRYSSTYDCAPVGDFRGVHKNNV